MNTSNGIQLSMAAPTPMYAAAIEPGSPAFDINQTVFRLTMKNVSSLPITLPFEEIRRNSVRVYRNLEGVVVHTDNRTPPPTRKGLVESVLPGESCEIAVQFHSALMGPVKYPSRFCLQWRSEWLQAKYYKEGSYQWNQSFEICANLPNP